MGRRKQMKKLRRRLARGFGDFVVQALAEFTGHLMGRGTKLLAKSQKRRRRDADAAVAEREPGH